MSKGHFLKQFKEIAYKLKLIYLYNEGNITRYLFITEELKKYFNDYMDDFIYYFDFDYKIKEKNL